MRFAEDTIDPRERVAMAAEWMDQTYPGWAEKIDLEEFDMSVSDICVAGYNDLDWNRDLRERYTEQTGRDATALFSSYDAEWRYAIALRA